MSSSRISAPACSAAGGWVGRGRTRRTRAGLHETNPGVTVISMGGMGQDGPWKDFVTFAPTIHALTGLTYLTNPPEEHLLGYGFSLTDHLSGLAGALAALEGVEHRDRTGE